MSPFYNISGISLSSEGMKKKPFLRKRLTVLALIIFASTIFVPWVVEMGFGLTPSYFWSFMTHVRWLEIRRWGTHQLISHNNWFFFQHFWFKTFGSSYQYVIGPSEPYGLYLGWLLIFVCQISTLVLWLVHLFKPAFLKKNVCIFGVIVFPFVSLLTGVYQRYVQWEIHYHSDTFYQSQVFSYFGLWLAVVSVALLLISFRRAPESTSLKRFKTRKVALGIFLVCVLGFFVVNELEFQTKVTKLMVVGKRANSGEELPGDPKLWEGDFNRIVTVANVFRARVYFNSPKYYHCELEVPVVSYGVLMVIYNSMGYRAYEPTFLYISE